MFLLLKGPLPIKHGLDGVSRWRFSLLEFPFLPRNDGWIYENLACPCGTGGVGTDNWLWMRVTWCPLKGVVWPYSWEFCWNLLWFCNWHKSVLFDLASSRLSLAPPKPGRIGCDSYSIPYPDTAILGPKATSSLQQWDLVQHHLLFC